MLYQPCLANFVVINDIQAYYCIDGSDFSIPLVLLT